MLRVLLLKGTYSNFDEVSVIILAFYDAVYTKEKGKLFFEICFYQLM